MNRKILTFIVLIQVTFPCFAQSLESVPLNADVSIPVQIQPPVGRAVAFSAHALGYQIYQCSLNEGKYSWAIQAPDAKLFDGKGHEVGSHYSGPVWEDKKGSRVVGQIISRVDVDPDSSISWLLAKAIAHKGKGLFSRISYINRINTLGGLPPLSGCNANHLGSEQRVAYTADYVFYE